MSGPVTIWVFCNHAEHQWYSFNSLCDCGMFIAGHICSSEGWAPFDMGLTSSRKHEYYDAHCKEHHDGATWKLELVPTEQVRSKSHPGLMAAYDNHLKLADSKT